MGGGWEWVEGGCGWAVPFNASPGLRISCFFFFKLQQLELSDQDSFQFLNKNDSFLKRLDAFILKGKFICE